MGNQEEQASHIHDDEHFEWPMSIWKLVLYCASIPLVIIPILLGAAAIGYSTMSIAYEYGVVSVGGAVGLFVALNLGWLIEKWGHSSRRHEDDS